MQERKLRWYLFGAQAAIVWGSPRLSVSPVGPAKVLIFVLALLGATFSLRFRELSLHFPDRDRGLLTSPFDQSPERRAGLKDDVLPLLALDPDENGGGPAVTCDDDAVVLGDVHALADALL